MKRTKRTKKQTGINWQMYAAIAVLSLVLVVFFVSAPFSILEVKKLDVTYMVSEKAGFDLNASALSYGGLLPGSKGTRIVNIDNLQEFPIYATFYPENDIDDLLFFNRTKQMIPVGGNLSLPITLIVPTDAPYGNYSSFIVVKIRK